MSIHTKLACFVGGTILGTVGTKLFASKDAKKVYIHATAAGLRAKDSVMESVTTLQENVADIVASAKDLNEARRQEESVEMIETIETDEE